MKPDALEIFDFDWTMFRSPLPPRGRAEKTWWDSPKSLEPPHVPSRPGSAFWIEEVVQELRDAQRRNQSITMVITGRRSDVMMRVKRLLEQKHLDPDFVIHRQKDRRKDKDIINFKRISVIDLLDVYPTIRRVVLWEDIQEQINDMRDLAKRRKIKFEGNLITEIANAKR